MLKENGSKKDTFTQNKLKIRKDIMRNEDLKNLTLTSHIECNKGKWEGSSLCKEMAEREESLQILLRG